MSQVAASKIGIPQVRIAQYKPAQIDAAKIGSSQVGTAEVDRVSSFDALVKLLHLTDTKQSKGRIRQKSWCWHVLVSANE